MNIYTRGGDGGETSLFGGKRVSKHALQVVAYGEVDELNAVLGWCAVVATQADTVLLQRESARLFTLGSYFAASLEANLKALPSWDEGAILELESEIDAWTKALPPLKNFLLPGGAELGARLQIARTVCRRAERVASALASESSLPDGALAYLNRLSDWLFTFARAANLADQSPETLWPGQSAESSLDEPLLP